MEAQLAQELIKAISPGFYSIGALMVLILVTCGSTLISIWARRSDDANKEFKAVVERLVRLETKLDDLTHDVNNIGSKLREKT